MFVVANCDDGFFSDAHNQCISLPSLGSGCSVIADVIIALDASGSVGSLNFERVRAFAKRFAEQFVVRSNAVRVAVVTFASRVTVEFEFDSNGNRIQRNIDAILYRGGSTRTDLALETAMSLFEEKAGNLNRVDAFVSCGDH